MLAIASTELCELVLFVFYIPSPLDKMSVPHDMKYERICFPPGIRQKSNFQTSASRSARQRGSSAPEKHSDFSYIASKDALEVIGVSH